MNEKNTHTQDNDDTAALIADRTLSFYTKAVRTPVLIGIVLGIASIVAQTPVEVFWAIYVIIFAVIGWYLVKTHQATIAQGIVAGAYAGALIGFVVAIARLIAFRLFYHFFNIVTDPILIGLLGAGTVAITVWIVSQDVLAFSKMTKGGESRARKKQSK